MTRKVIITGLGVISPIGNDLKTTWQGIINGASGIKRISGFDASTFPVQIAGEITDFSFDTSLLPEELQNLTGRSIQLGIEASGMALKDSGLELKKEDPVKIGVSLGGDEEYIKIGNIENIYAKDLVHNAFVEGQNAYCHLLKHSPSVAKNMVRKKKNGYRHKDTFPALQPAGPPGNIPHLLLLKRTCAWKSKKTYRRWRLRHCFIRRTLFYAF